MNNINRFIIKEKWALYSSALRYGNGFFIAISPAGNYLYQLDDILTGPDIGAIELEGFFKTVGAWLPVVFSKDLTEGLEMLDQKLATIENTPDFYEKVVEAFYSLIKSDDGFYGITKEVENHPEKFKFDVSEE